MKKLIFRFLSVICGLGTLLFLMTAISLFQDRAVIGIGSSVMSLGFTVLLGVLTLLLWRKSGGQRPAPQPVQTSPSPAATPSEDVPVLDEILSVPSPLAEDFSEDDPPEKSKTIVESAPLRGDETKIHVENTDLTYQDAKLLRFWDFKHTDFQIPSYYQKDYLYKDAAPALERFLEKGYLQKSGLEKNIALKTIPELKEVLAAHGMKTTGKKPELVSRLLENLPADTLEQLFPVGVYRITETGQAALAPYDLLLESDQYGLTFPYFRLIQARKAYPTASGREIFAKLFAEDIEKSYREQKPLQYANVVSSAGVYAQKLGEPEKALTCFILAFFTKYMSKQLAIQAYYDNENMEDEDDIPYIDHYIAARNIDRCGRQCGYSLEQLEDAFGRVIRQYNPFGLGTTVNIQKAFATLKDDLSLTE